MNWQSFKSLFELYEVGKTKNKATLLDNAEFKYHSHQTRELLFTKNEILVSKTTEFQNSFEKLYLNKYQVCLNLLESIGENTPHCRFEVDDILRLEEMRRQMNNGELEEVRQQIIASNETRRGGIAHVFSKRKALRFKCSIGTCS